MTNSLLHLLTRRPPAGPAGYLPRPRHMTGSFPAMHDRPTRQPQYDSGVPRRNAITKVPLVALDAYSRKQRRVS